MIYALDTNIISYILNGDTILEARLMEIKNSPKTSAGNREVPVTDELYGYLKQYLPTVKSLYVFPTAQNTLMTQSSYSRMWDKIINAINLSAGGRNGKLRVNKLSNNITPHMIRHTYATLLYEAGVDIKVAQYLMGHSSIKITMDIYTDLSNKKKIDRYNILIMLVYILGIILLLQLFSLQILHGQEYREESNLRLTRETTLKAARGVILDRTGQEIVGNKMGFSLELYQTKSDDKTLNRTILNMINVLNKNGDSYTDSFPIKVNPFEFTFTKEESILNFKDKNKIAREASAEDCFNFFKAKYKIENESVDDARKILGIRYEITGVGYSNTKAITISKNISRESAIEFNEESFLFPGLNIVVEPVRDYKSR